MPVTSFVPAIVWDFTAPPPAKKKKEEVRAPAPSKDSFVPCPYYDFSTNPPRLIHPGAPAYDFPVDRAPTRRELRTEVRAIRRHRNRLLEVLERVPADSPDRGAFERAVGRVIGRRWAEPRTSPGRKRDARHEEKMQYVKRCLAVGPRPTWKEVAGYVNDAFGTEYEAETLRRYFARWRKKLRQGA